MSEATIGTMLDNLGVTASLDDSQHITEVLVLAKITSFENGETALGMYSSPSCDWITRLGLLHAARDVLDATPPQLSDSED